MKDIFRSLGLAAQVGLTVVGSIIICLFLGMWIDARLGTTPWASLILTIVGADGAPVEPRVLSATLGRATHVADDRTPAFVFDGEALVAPVDLAPGYWNLRFAALAPDGTEFRQRIEIFVRPES